MGCKLRSTKCLSITFVVGLLVFAAGVGLLAGFAVFTKNTVIADTTLIPGTTAYDTWIEPPTPLSMQYWVWDLQNPQEFLNGEKPILKEKGPYTYLEYRSKESITHFHENGTVRFRNYKVYVFDLENSVGPVTDTFTTANIPVFTVANLLKHSSDPIQNIQKLIHAISGASSIIEVSIDDILWGYEDEYLSLIDQLIPGLLPTTEFGLFQGSNNTVGPEWFEYTGQTSHTMTGQVVTWDDMEYLPWWNTDYANRINGSDGAVIPPFVEKNDKVYFYVPDICRSGYLTYEYSYQLRGITVGRFSAPSYLYEYSEDWPENDDFCTPDGNICPPTGLLNATECQSGAPIYYSSPHFLYGEDSLLDSVVGMSPDKEQHMVYFDIQMLTGIIMEVANRLQVNMFVEPFDWVDDTLLLTPTYLPILWLNESTTIDEASADFFKGSIQTPLLIARIIIILLLGLGGGMIIGVLVTCICWRYKGKQKYCCTSRVGPQQIDDQQGLTSENKKSQELKEAAT